MRTQEEIAAKIKEEHGKFLSFVPDVLIHYLTFDTALQFLDKEKIAEAGEDKAREEWGEPQTSEQTVEAMRSYMEFAWEKAIDQRGLSADRSIQKMEAWMFALGREDEVTWDDYAPYGKPILLQICKIFEFPIPDGELLTA